MMQGMTLGKACPENVEAVNEPHMHMEYNYTKYFTLNFNCH